VWELKRPLLDRLPTIDMTLLPLEYLESPDDTEKKKAAMQQAKADCILHVTEALLPDNPMSVIESIKNWLESMPPSNVLSIYEDLNDQLPTKNGFITETNPTISTVLGCSSNAILLGNLRQSKGALYYIAPYICKQKTDLTTCLMALSNAQTHIAQYPSRADDSGTNSRTVTHLFTRVLNSMWSQQQVSDTQVALALLNELDTEAASDSFKSTVQDICIIFFLRS